MLALETISDNGKELITKGKKYVIGKELGYNTKCYIIDNYGDKLYLTKEEILSKFKLSGKEHLSVWKEAKMITLNYDKNNIVFENRLAILLTRNKINYNWIVEGMEVSEKDIQKANKLIEYLENNNRPVWINLYNRKEDLL